MKRPPHRPIGFHALASDLKLAETIRAAMEAKLQIKISRSSVLARALHLGLETMRPMVASEAVQLAANDSEEDDDG